MPKNEQFPIEDIKKSVKKLHAEKPFVTSGDIASAVGCSRETARFKLNQLADREVLKSQMVGARAKIWYDPNSINNRVSGEPKTEEGNVNEDLTNFQRNPKHGTPTTNVSATNKKEEERVLFFPSRREIVVDFPKDSTRRTLSQTAHLVDSTGDGYLYKIDQTDIWNAPYDTFEGLRNDLIQIVGEDSWDGGFESRIKDDWDRANQFRLTTHPNGFTTLEARSSEVFEDVAKRKLEYGTHYTEYLSDTSLRVTNGAEAEVKESLYDAGYPAVDERRIEQGASLNISLADELNLRDYQEEWIKQFSERQGGVFVGPSGSGKTIAALGVIDAIGGETLIIVPNRELVQQWVDEIRSKTTISPRKIGQYHGATKQIRPITVATYDTTAMSRHRELFNERDWGLVIADECHHSVASTWKRFREIQSTARLGLSATPVREASDPKEIYTLIGPPIGTDWGSLFTEGWVEKPAVEIISVPWANDNARERYQRASGSKRLIEAARNPIKSRVIDSLLETHSGQQTLIFVDWIKQGNELAEDLDLPFVYGDTKHDEREQVYNRFRNGGINALIVSRIGDEGIDLPDAEVAILASTMGSSRSQTGQRAGRTMRPFGNAKVYVILTKGSGEEDWGRESTQFLAEKGIDVTKADWSRP